MVRPEADAKPPETVPDSAATPERPQDSPTKLVCGRLVPADRT
jgi:hypothetical protein